MRIPPGVFQVWLLQFYRRFYPLSLFIYLFFFDETWVQKHVFFSFFPLLKHEKFSGLQNEDNFVKPVWRPILAYAVRKSLGVLLFIFFGQGKTVT